MEILGIAGNEKRGGSASAVLRLSYWKIIGK